MPNQVDWQQLLTEKRYKTSNVIYIKAENAYCNDSMKIIRTDTFQQLPKKSHIFPLAVGVASRSSLDHTLETSYFAKLIVHKFAERNLRQSISFQEVAKMAKTVSAAGLLYEVGLPAFGYSGQKAIRDWFQRQLPRMTYRDKKLKEWLSDSQYYDLTHLGRASQRLRIVRKLHDENQRGKLNLTYPILTSLLHRPRADGEGIDQHRLGYYQSEIQFFETLKKELSSGTSQHPLSLIVEAAAELAGSTSVIREGLSRGLISHEELLNDLRDRTHQLDLTYEQLYQIRQLLSEGPHHKKSLEEQLEVNNVWIEQFQLNLVKAAASSFNKNYSLIINGQYEVSLFTGTDIEPLLRCIQEFGREQIYQHPQFQVSKDRNQGIIEDLLQHLVTSAISLDQEIKTVTVLDQLLGSEGKQNQSEEKNQIRQGDTLYRRVMMVVDFLTNLSDQEALNLHKKLN